MPGASLPMIFQPERVYVLEDVWGSADAARRAERICAGCPTAEVRTFGYADLPDIVREEGWAHGARMGSMAASRVLMPSSTRLWLAPVGQTVTHGASAQCRHDRGKCTTRAAPRSGTAS